MSYSFVDALATARLSARRIFDFPSRIAARRSFNRQSHRQPAHGIVASYGNVLDGKQCNIHGGKVKLLHLREVFPESPDAFNILYLVSSARPRHAGELVRWARTHKARFVLNQNGVAYPSWAGTAYKSYNEPMRSLLRQADFVFYQSEFCRRASDHFLGKAHCPFEIAYNCVDLDQFIPAAVPAPSPWRLLAIGTHEQSRRVLCVLETVKELSRRNMDVTLTIAGKLAWRGAVQEVEEAVAKLDISRRVTFHPSFTQEHAVSLYQAAHVVLHPKYNDPCPTVPIEAMACGIPVIGSKSGGMPELVPQSAGVLIDVPQDWGIEHWPDARVMADAVCSVMNRHAEFRNAARMHAVAHFGKSGWVEQHRRVFESLLQA